MSATPKAKVLPFETRATRAARSRRGKSAEAQEKENLRKKIEELEAKLRSVESSTRVPEGLVIELTRFFAQGMGSLSWDRVARLLAAGHFAWHSEETDEFGYDPKFTETIRPFLEFMYTVWWRVETTGIERVPGAGPTLCLLYTSPSPRD